MCRPHQRRRHVQGRRSWRSTTSATTPAAGVSTAPALRGRPDRRRPRRHRRLRQRRRLGRAQQRQRRVPPPQLVVDNFGFNAGGWRVERHPRFLADVTGDGRADIVGFGNAGVWVSRNNGNGTFQAAAARGRQLRLQRRRLAGRSAPAVPGRRDRRRPRGHRRLRQRRRVGVAQQRQRHVPAAAAGGRTTSATTPAAGGRQHPRFLADTPATGAPTSSASATPASGCRVNNGDGTFEPPQLVVANFGYDAGGWRVDQHPRFLADLAASGRADIVGFGNAGVWVSLQQRQRDVPRAAAGGEQLRLYRGRLARRPAPRLVAADIGGGRADIIGFGNDGVWVSQS